MEQVDEEGKKYLNYKSISGMDLVPRMREPTPPKKQAKDDPHKFDTNPSCDCCSKNKMTWQRVVDENAQLKRDMKQLQLQIEQMRLLQQAKNRQFASRTGQLKGIDYSGPFIKSN